MKIAVIGSEGYLGRHLCLELHKHDLVRIDSGVYGQYLDQDVVRKHSGHVEALDGAEAVVYLAAYAHDPDAKIGVSVMECNNCLRVARVQEYCSDRGIPLHVVSSLAVFGCENPYSMSKRSLEVALAAEPNTAVHRFGTLFGRGANVLSYRPHLLLNRMVLDACRHGVIKVFGPSLRRPTLPVDMAAKVLRGSILHTGPLGTVTNHYMYSGRLIDYARAVQKVCREHEVFPTIEVSGAVDARDYGWGPTSLNLIESYLHDLVRFTESNLPQLSASFDAFPDNLYKFIEENE